MNRFKIQDLRFKNVIFVIIILTSYYLLPTTLIAADPPVPTPYKLLAPIPQLVSGPGDTTTAPSYVPGLVKLAIALAGLLAVIRIIYGGFLYISSEGFGTKSNAKGIIEGAFWGLILAMSAWIILNTIDPSGRFSEFTLDVKNYQAIRGNLPGTDGFTDPDIGLLPDVESPVLTNCANCVTLAVDGKTAAQGGCRGTGICQVNADLNASLVLLSASEPNLYVTEAYPPTVAHQDPCHARGTCVDAKIKDVNTPTPQQVRRFLQNAEAAGLGGTIFEAANASRRTILIGGGVNPSKVIVTEGNGEHFHVKR